MKQIIIVRNDGEMKQARLQMIQRNHNPDRPAVKKPTYKKLSKNKRRKMKRYGKK